MLALCRKREGKKKVKTKKERIGKTMKTTKILSVLLAVLMVLAIMPALSYGAEGDAMCETFDGTYTPSGTLLKGGNFCGGTSASQAFGAFTVKQDGSGNNYLSQTLTAVNGNTQSGIFLKPSENPGARYQVVDFDVMIKNVSGKSAGARIHIAGEDSKNRFGGFTIVSLGIWNSVIYVYGGNSSNSDNMAVSGIPQLWYSDYGIENFDAGKDDWRNVKIIFDKNTLQYDLIFDGKLIATDIPSQRLNSSLNLQTFSFNTNAASVGSESGVDNIRFYETTAATANELTSAAFLNLVKDTDLYSSNVIAMPYSGLVGYTATNASAASKYAYSISDNENAAINRSLYNTAEATFGANSAITVSNLPETALDKALDIDLTATITRYDDSNNPVVKTVTYDLKAEKTDLPSFMDITGTNASLVTEYLNLPTTFVSGETEYGVSWTSDSELISVSTGTVLRRNNAQKVNLTATFSKNGATTKTVKYPVTILADGQLYIDEAFDTFADKNGETVEGYNSWGYLLNSSYKAQVDAKFAVDPKQAAGAPVNNTIRLSRVSDSKQASVSKAFSETLTGKVNVEARVYIDKLASEEVFNIGLFASKSAGAKVAVLTFRNGLVNYKTVQNAGGSESVVAINDYAYTEDSWMDLKLVLDTNKRTYDVYINGAKINTEPVYFYCKTDEVKAQRGTPDEFNYIDFDLRGAAGDAVYIDDVVVYTPDEDSFKVMDLDVNAGTMTLFDKSDADDAAKAFVAAYSGEESSKVLDTAIAVDISSFGGKYVKTFNFDLGAYKTNPEIKVFVFENDTIKPLMMPFTYGESSDKIKTTVYIAGDSTAQTYANNKYPQTGWGQLLSNYFDSENIVVSNNAMGGRSSRSFITEGRLDRILNEITPGDYILIQFGHNDSKTTPAEAGGVERYTEPSTSYHDYLSVYVREARKKGAIPVFVTSISRLDKYFDEENGSSLGAYPAEMRELAAKLNVPVIDMFAKSVEKLNTLELDDAKEIYLFLEPDDARYINDAEFAESVYKTKGAADGTHFSRYGATLWTEMIAEALKTQIGGVFAESYIE